MAALKAKLGELRHRLPVKLVVLFGSYAKGNYTVASDVDVLVVYSGDHREDAYAAAKRALALPRLEPHVYSEAEYEQARETVDRMMVGGIQVFP